MPTEIWRLGLRSGSARVRREDVLGSKAVQTLLFCLGAEKPHKGKWAHVLAAKSLTHVHQHRRTGGSLVDHVCDLSSTLSFALALGHGGNASNVAGFGMSLDLPQSRL